MTTPVPVPVALVLADMLHSDWREGGSCAQSDPEAWFPEKGQSTRYAKKVCAACPVRAECLEDALARNEPYGIWGGLSGRERRLLKQATQPTPTPATPAEVPDAA